MNSKRKALSELLEYFHHYDPETGTETQNIDYTKLVLVLEDILDRLEKLEQKKCLDPIDIAKQGIDQYRVALRELFD